MSKDPEDQARREGRSLGGVGGEPHLKTEAGGTPARPEWRSRGYLPHRDRGGLRQMVTFRLADSLPQAKLRQLEQELQVLPDTERDRARRTQIEQWLDAGMGSCALRHPEAARFVQSALRHFDDDRYALLAWCIMPNHVHVLIGTWEPWPLAGILHSWKSFTAKWLLKHNTSLRLGLSDPKRVWAREYWDRYIRNERHLMNAVAYIEENPVKAGLCLRAEDWEFGSAPGRGRPLGKG